MIVEGTLGARGEEVIAMPAPTVTLAPVVERVTALFDEIFAGIDRMRVRIEERFAAGPVDAAAVDALPVGHALLVVQRGPGSGNRFLLDTDKVTAGRHPDSEIFLDDVTVSRRHAVFDRAGSTFTVSDVGSLNGTYVNRDRIDTVQLKDGDEVQVGKYRLVFFSGHEVQG